MKKAVCQHLSSFWNGIQNLFGSRYDDLPFDRVVFVAGINSSERKVAPFIKFLTKQFPSKKVVVIRQYYLHNQEVKVEEMIMQTRKAIDVNERCLVIGHSFGGVVALAALGRSKKCENVALLATLGTPHGIEEFGMAAARKRHDMTTRCDAPVMSFGGLIDAVVPDALARYEGAINHVTLPCTHIAFIRTSRTRKEILAAIAQFFATQKK